MDTLGPLDYSVVRNRLSGEDRVERGPQQLFLGPYDEPAGDDASRTVPPAPTHNQRKWGKSQILCVLGWRKRDP